MSLSTLDTLLWRVLVQCVAIDDTKQGQVVQIVCIFLVAEIKLKSTEMVMERKPQHHGIGRMVTMYLQNFPFMLLDIGRKSCNKQNAQTI